MFVFFNSISDSLFIDVAKEKDESLSWKAASAGNRAQVADLYYLRLPERTGEPEGQPHNDHSLQSSCS